MSALRLLRLTAGGGRALRVSVRRGSHDVAPHNPGPPTTYDYMPIPCQPYAKVHGELQRKFNVYLGVGVGLLVTSLACAFGVNLFSTECMRPPKSWYDRK